VTVTDIAGRTPLHIAAHQDYPQRYGYDYGYSDDYYMTFRAEQTRRNALVEQLIARGAAVNARDFAGRTPLHEAAGGRGELVSVFLRHGAEVNARDKGGVTPLHRAAQYGDDATITTLLKAGAAVNAVDRHGATPMDYAVGNGMEDTVILLLEHGGYTAKRRQPDWVNEYQQAHHK
jgi:ankyrin repeat protein